MYKYSTWRRFILLYELYSRTESNLDYREHLLVELEHIYPNSIFQQDIQILQKEYIQEGVQKLLQTTVKSDPELFSGIPFVRALFTFEKWQELQRMWKKYDV